MNPTIHDPLKDPQKAVSSTSFEHLGISKSILEILAKNQYSEPTPIQHQAIPIAVTGKDIVGIAQTGTGKTLAFGIPLLQRIGQLKTKGLVILPTRELALQVNEALVKLGGPLGLRTAVLIGGENIQRQLYTIRKDPHVVIATPGRLIDHLKQGNIHLNKVSILVLDEADRMFDMGFVPQLKQILAAVPKERQTMLFSATMPAEIVQIATKHMIMPLRIEVAPAGTSAETVEQEILIVKKEGKPELLEKLLQEIKGTILIFSRTKHGATKICKQLQANGHGATEIHSNRSLGQRRAALDGFKSGRYRILVATDIAARGIDVKDIELVLNYDLPDASEDYVHRIGRTGRAGKKGRAISFALPSQKRDIMQIERLIRKSLPISNKETATFSNEVYSPYGARSGGQRSYGGGGYRGRSNRTSSSRPSQSRGQYGSSRQRSGGQSGQGQGGNSQSRSNREQWRKDMRQR